MNRSQRVLASASLAGVALLFVLALVISYQFQSAGYYSDQAEHTRGILIAVQNQNRGLVKAESGQRGASCSLPKSVISTRILKAPPLPRQHFSRSRDSCKMKKLHRSNSRPSGD